MNTKYKKQEEEEVADHTTSTRFSREVYSATILVVSEQKLSF